ncbi:MAG: hypothetical protein N0C80_14425 [Candidatus Thiodiazotropha endolucinida]|nr:hypothetical protein [Candidatus Thiodiazotropha taylori]MCW4272099.1 hypothetical protein [Candidatus Thiodiazotropha endolucinida]
MRHGIYRPPLEKPIELKAVPGARQSPGRGVKETRFGLVRKPSVRLKSFGPKTDVFVDVYGKEWRGKPSGTPPKIEEFSPAMKAQASARLSVSPPAPPKYPTLESIKTGEALKQAYLERQPITAVKKALKGGGVSGNPILTSRNTSAVASLGGQAIQPTQLFKGVKGGVSTLDRVSVDAAIAHTRSVHVDSNSGNVTGAESHSSYLKRLKAADKDLKSTQKAINRVLKNAKKAVSKHVDGVFRAQQKNAVHDIKTIRTELSGLRAELRSDLKKIQTMPIRSNEVALKNLGVRPASVLSRSPAMNSVSSVNSILSNASGISVSSVGSLESSHFEKYKPHNEADRAVKFQRRWKDGRVEIQRVERKLDDQIARMKADRVARKWLKKQLSQDVRGAGKELTGEVQRLRLRNKARIQRTKQRIRKTRMATLRTRLARILR